jgi:branched-subunit amino acid ABC-type transport system permease component
LNAVVFNGLFVGLIYGLIGVGLVVSYRGSRVVNFAYGETGMIAAFVFTDIRFGTGSVGVLVKDHGLLIAFPVAIILAALLGAATEYFIVRRMRDAPRIIPLVGTFAVGSLLLTYGLRRWGTTVRHTEPVIDGDGFRMLGLQVQPEQVLIAILSLLVLTGLWALYRFTAFGLRLRATALDPYAAGLVGVNVNQTSLMTWALAGALAGLSAILIGPLVTFNVLFMATLSIRGLAAALVGGLTNIWGAFGAGILIGVVEGVIAYKSPVSGITDAVLAVTILVLMVARPAGLVRSAY